MLRHMRCAVVVMTVLAAAGQARAQYGRYGWNGWGASSAGNSARGLGNLYAGRGSYNESNAVAGAINTNTALQWNNAIYQATLAGAQRYNSQNRYEMQKVNKDRAQVDDRVRNHPEQLDITNGNALNMLLTELLRPDNAELAISRIKTPIRSDSIRDIPFEAASEGITICLDQMTMDEQWPLALRVDAFKADRATLKAAVATAMKADEDGSLEPSTIAAVTTAVKNLQTKFDQEVKPSDPNYYPARDTVKAMAGLTKMLDSPKLEQVLAELEDYQGTTLGDLLALMQSFNLRFAPSNSFRQRQIYIKLYPLFAEQANGTADPKGSGSVANTEKVATPPAPDLKGAATDLFKGLGDK